MTSVVGLIANPTSGKDIRRLVAFGSVFDNNEKINIIQRLLRGLDAMGITQVCAMPDVFGLAEQAYDKAGVKLNLKMLDMKITNTADDSTTAARLMDAAGVHCLVTLGGDGTNRAVAKGCGYVPIVPISTGTNNAFPEMIEGTLAGLAAAAVALRVPGVWRAAVHLARRLDILRNGEVIDFALMDIVVYDEQFIASKAIWDISKIKTIISSHVRPSAIGASAVAGYLPDPPPNRLCGAWIETGAGKHSVIAPFAPGVMAHIPIKTHYWLAVGEIRNVTVAPAVLALDGERELLIKRDDIIQVSLSQNGPHVVDIRAALQLAAQSGLFHHEGGG